MKEKVLIEDGKSKEFISNVSTFLDKGVSSKPKFK